MVPLARGALADEDAGAFAGAELAPLAGCEAGQIKFADADAEQAQGGVADGGGHPADLMVFSLDQRKGDPAIGDVFAEANGRVARGDERLRVEEPGAAGEGLVGADAEAALEWVERFACGDAFDLGP